MEEYLTQLNLERDYEEMLKHLLNKEKITRIENYFTGLNIKVLLSSFLIKNFHEYFLLTAQDNLVKNSKKICEHIMNKDLENTQINYKDFYDSFVNWRDFDIRCMKAEIQNAKSNLENILTENEPEDDAEEQWNEGVKINMKIMDNTVKMLDIYGKTPPKK